MSGIAQVSFFASAEQRVQLARRRYFDEGISPSGVVSDAVFQSWIRCQRLHFDPAGGVVFEPVTPSRTNLSLQKNRPLRDAWMAELPTLESTLGASTCAAMLTDATGMLIGATCAGRAHERLMPIATRLGVDLSEEAVGTTAPGVVARTGQPVSVVGAEHYFEEVKGMNCAAAPVRDIRGRVAGVLDISSETVPFSFDAESVVALFASAIENRLLLAQATQHLVIFIQVAPSLLDSPVVGLVGIDLAGDLAWSNGAASRLLGLPLLRLSGEPTSTEAALGAGVSALASLPPSGASAIRLPNGLTVWARSAMRASDGRRRLVDVPWQEIGRDVLVAAPAPAIAAEKAATERTAAPMEGKASMRDCDLHLIERTIKECDGNISRAAKALRVSRGLIYRRMGGPQDLSEVADRPSCSCSEQLPPRKTRSIPSPTI